MQSITPQLVSWASILEPQTREQACETARMPFTYPHVALMPDAHLGRGATLGSAIPPDRAINPAAVGVDDAISATAQPRIDELSAMAGIEQADDALPRWRLQLGSLGSGTTSSRYPSTSSIGSGCSCTPGRAAWATAWPAGTSRSRSRCARLRCGAAESGSRYLTEGTAEFDSYVQALTWAQHFALLNRDEMMDRVIDCATGFFDAAVMVAQKVACHHNYTVREHHFGRDVWLSRKGAIISARPGQLGLIPGSMGARSYVVSGKGDVDSLSSAPHGAGRQFSRTAAKRRFTAPTWITAWPVSRGASPTHSSTSTRRRTRTSTW